MTEQFLTAVVGSRKLAGADWQLAVERPIKRAEQLSPCDAPGCWIAVLGIRRGLRLLVTGNGKASDLLVGAWAGEPGDSSDGVGVVKLADGNLAVGRIPLCRCGERGCGNVGIQLSKQVPAGDLPALVDLLRTLPWTDATPTRSNVLRGDGLAALPLPCAEPGPSRNGGARIRRARIR